ncbi:MAG: MBL fold metallo-hydrolase [Streptococcaceae bacterium]|nr:MBL fold metallo-hydrolase [Streptococcaceae bacterium]
MEQKDKVEITFHAGVLTIGGTVVEVAYKDAHLFFDFGTEFRPELDLPDDKLETLLLHQLIPDLEGLYDERLNHVYQGESVRQFKHTAVFISHAHLDHTRMINYLEPSIPMYALEATASVVPALNKNGDFLIPSPFEAQNFTREITGLKPYSKVQLGEIEVEIAPVDHDAYGAAGLIIRVAGKKIAYTGDLRLHGYDPQDTVEFCKRAFHADALIMEGVSISFPEREHDAEAVEIQSEQDLITQMIKLINENPKRQLTFNGYPANLKRFSQIVKQSPREVVLNSEMATLLLEVFGQKVHYYTDENTVSTDKLDPQLEVPYQELLDDDEHYFWQVTTHFERLQKGGLYIHSDATPLGDFDPAYAKFLALLAELDITFVRLACSGHAIPDDLDKIISMIEPQLLLPIHSYHPEKLENPYGRRILPTRGQTVAL